jgi:hypothetical protein
MPGGGVERSVRVVPGANTAAQVLPQTTPTGSETTVPPGSEAATVTVTPAGSEAGLPPQAASDIDNRMDGTDSKYGVRIVVYSLLVEAVEVALVHAPSTFRASRAHTLSPTEKFWRAGLRSIRDAVPG